MSELVFVDTNILLDFYRLRGPDTDLSILRHIDQHAQIFIATCQVEMEFKKNRPAVIMETYNGIKAPDGTSVRMPAFLQSKQAKALARSRVEMERLQRAIKDRISRSLKDPKVHDPVYQAAHRLFRSKSPNNLTLDSAEHDRMRRLAFRRWITGYPPRKRTDTAIGDALNWEWIVRCALESGAHIVIASRDGDFGTSFGKKLFLNDWLKQEFGERVSRKRRIRLVDSLSGALKIAGVKVSAKEQKAEASLIATIPNSKMIPHQGLNFGAPSTWSLFSGSVASPTGPGLLSFIPKLPSRDDNAEDT